MTELLTESFCERCGTRYTFESTARRASPLGALGTVGRGLRNFVASPDSSLDEAFAVARAETEQRATAHQLEAFHRTFNFCLSCRQYTCADCWNAVEGRCLSCSPLPEAEITYESARIDAADAVVASGPADLAWPTIDIHEHLAAETHEAVIVARPESTPEPSAEESEAWPVEIELEEPAAQLEVAALALEPEAAVLEPEPEATVPEPELEAARPAFAAPPEPEPEPTSVEAAVPEPELEAAAPEPTSPPEPERRRPILPFPPGASLDDEIAAYDLRIAALTATPPEPTVVAPPPSPTVGSPPPPTAAPLRPAARADEPTPPEGRPSPAPMPATPAMSATPRVTGPIHMPAPPRAVVPELPPAMPGTEPIGTSTGTCPSCGLSLSASARFCRRCGTQQRV